MLKTFSITDIGKTRKINQDYVFTSEKSIGNLPNLFLVADGMGGHKAGDYASRCAVETMCEVIEKDLEKDPKLVLQKAIEAANLQIYKKSKEDENLDGMGTTIVAATCLGNSLQVANVGDSRLYVVGEDIRQITQDHSLVEEMVRMGAIDRETAKNHAKKNYITRAIGAGEKVEIDFFTVELKTGDSILLCSDGLTNMLEDEEIRMIMESQRDVVERVEALVEEANKRGGIDNITVVLIEPIAQ
ncbi:MAG: Stp1/IreP family PP2C-type Ser/Thr phosphatase [Lachnospiraceae bacterium]|nr:Stp1/IreP family PP2C-type Ser/Thr phosphatase [Lachnospiraceae bacterium]